MALSLFACVGAVRPSRPSLQEMSRNTQVKELHAWAMEVMM